MAVSRRYALPARDARRLLFSRWLLLTAAAPHLTRRRQGPNWPTVNAQGIGSALRG